MNKKICKNCKHCEKRNFDNRQLHAENISYYCSYAMMRICSTNKNMECFKPTKGVNKCI